jgi:hypothetical protein
MGENVELEALRRRVAELEKQLADERESFEWDFKAAKEAADATIRKLEQQLAEYKKPSSQVGNPDAELLQKRALLAERKVAELQAEVQKLQSARLEKSSAAGDSFMRQRAEQAEREREELRKEKRTLERKLEELDNRLRKQQEELAKSAALPAELDKLRGELAAREREVKKLESSLAQATAGKSEKGPGSSAEKQLQEKNEEIEKLRREIDQLKITSGQMLEQREREKGRLQADLKQAQEQQAKAGQQLAEMQKQLDALGKELEQKRYEYTRLLEQHEKLRESQDTLVGRPPAPAEKKADPFEEKTVKTGVPAGQAGGETVKDGRPLGAQLPPPPVADKKLEGSEQVFFGGQEVPTDEVITGELVPEEEAKLEPLEPIEEDKEQAPPHSKEKPRFASSRTDIVREKAAGKPFPLNIWLSASPRKRVLMTGGLVLVLAAAALAAWWSVTAGQRTVEGQPAQTPAAEKPVAAEPEVAQPPAPAADAGLQPASLAEPVQEVSVEASDQQELQKRLAQIKDLMLKKNFDELLQVAKYLVEKYPKSALSHFYFGKALFYKKDLQAASDELYLSLQLDAQLREAWYELVGVNIVLKRKNRACEAASKYIEASPAQDARAAVLKKNLAKWGCR